eukprot:9294845-Pyramimonas_sp.AAC.1
MASATGLGLDGQPCKSPAQLRQASSSKRLAIVGASSQATGFAFSPWQCSEWNAMTPSIEPSSNLRPSRTPM